MISTKLPGKRVYKFILNNVFRNQNYVRWYGKLSFFVTSIFRRQRVCHGIEFSGPARSIRRDWRAIYCRRAVDDGQNEIVYTIYLYFFFIGLFNRNTSKRARSRMFCITIKCLIIIKIINRSRRACGTTLVFF